MENNSWYRTKSFEERRDLLIKMKDHGVDIGTYTWDECNIDDHSVYPILAWSCGSVTATSCESGYELTYEQFVSGLGIEYLPQGESIIRHKFI